jgi:hypothetical protein
MAGNTEGLQVLIKQSAPEAVLTFCIGHCNNQTGSTISYVDTLYHTT